MQSATQSTTTNKNETEPGPYPAEKTVTEIPGKTDHLKELIRSHVPSMIHQPKQYPVWNWQRARVTRYYM